MPEHSAPVFFQFNHYRNQFCYHMDPAARKERENIEGGSVQLISRSPSGLKEGQYLNRWLVISSLNSLPIAMVFPFSQVFAHEIKGANPFILAPWLRVPL